MAEIAAGLGLVGMFTGMAGADEEADALRDQGYDANKAAVYNAKVTMRAGLSEATRKRYEGQRVLAGQQAWAGASGAEVSGSILDVVEQTAYEVELDYYSTLWEARASAQAIKVAGRNALEQGKAGAKAAQLSGASSTLSSGSSLGFGLAAT